jgi:hypothetical protein
MVSAATEAGIDWAMSAKVITNPIEIRLIVIYLLSIFLQLNQGAAPEVTCENS